MFESRLIAEEIVALEREIDALVVYAQLKLDTRDWHGAIDALMDIRDAQAQLEILDAIEKGSLCVEDKTTEPQGSY